jgi:hypothetical protein
MGFGFKRRPTRIRFDYISARPRAEPVPAPAPGTSEHNLTCGQKIALLKLRGNDWSKAVLAKLEETGNATVAGDDFRSLVPLHLAINKGSFHVLTPSGRWRADRIAEEIARTLDIHVISYDYGRYGRAAFWECTCGDVGYHSRYAGDAVLAIGRGARLHLEHVGAAPKRDVA